MINNILEKLKQKNWWFMVYHLSTTNGKTILVSINFYYSFNAFNIYLERLLPNLKAGAY